MCLNTQETLDKKDFLKNKLKKVFHVFLYVLFSRFFICIIFKWNVNSKSSNN